MGAKRAMQDVHAESVKIAALACITKAKALAVTSAEDAEHATAIIRDLKFKRERWLALVEPVVKGANEAWKKAVAMRDSIAKPLDEAERYVKGLVGSYMDEQERQRREAEAAAQAEAQRLADEQRQREIEILQAAGEQEAAEAVAAAPVVAPVVVAAPVVKPAGMSTVENWKFRLIDPTLIPREYLSVDEVKLGRIVRALKGSTNIPGLQAYCETGVRTR